MSDAPATTIELGGRRVEVMGEPGGEAAMAAVVAAVATHDATCRRALAKAIGDEDSVGLYVRHHLEQLPGLAAELGIADPAAPGRAGARAFLARMHLRSIWVDGEDDELELRLDYTIDAARTDHVVTVTLDRRGRAVDVEMES